jgi:enterochelin esterase-like enzyme
MALTGKLTLALAVVLCLMAMLGAAAIWNRPWPSWWRWSVRGSALIAAQLTAVMVAGVLLNDASGFYTSWSQLWERPSPPRHVAARPGLDDTAARDRLARARAGHGVITTLEIPGTVSGAGSFKAEVYLPAAYGDPAHADRQFAVVELLAGYPGSPRSWLGPLGVADLLDSEIAAGRSAPFIAVLPTPNIAGARDTECVDVVHGPRVQTYLTQDVRSAVVKHFRAAGGPSSWALMGYSTGGFCATNIAMRHPDLYSAAVSVAGYFTPAHDATTGDLFGGRQQVRDQNTPIWLAAHRPSDVSLLLFATKEDRPAWTSLLSFLAAVRPPTRVDVVELARGGHNFQVWRPQLQVGIDWLGRRLAPPLAPLPTLDGQLPRTVSR